MKTPIQELFISYGHLLPDVEEYFLEKEKQQITDAYNAEHIRGCTAEIYYNETYKD